MLRYVIRTTPIVYNTRKKSVKITLKFNLIEKNRSYNIVFSVLYGNTNNIGDRDYTT